MDERQYVKFSSFIIVDLFGEWKQPQPDPVNVISNDLKPEERPATVDVEKSFAFQFVLILNREWLIVRTLSGVLDT